MVVVVVGHVGEKKIEWFFPGGVKKKKARQSFEF